ncbi:hypothetical protein BDZ85DRAFT_257718 [Elsinoe ampelina]|uniref:Uncharacterized protein n=1 Tax=Elsinoe ampelina TaxID=302913 RepID=A0A6A6GJI9_9PEZI|nr:hypothetical protein BDZ85DRAFT_257718 [Elsinoe ampelina]
MIRHRADERAAANHHHYYGNVPPTPGRQFSNPDMGYWTPHAQNVGLEPAPSQPAGIEGRESPVKRLQFR